MAFATAGHDEHGTGKDRSAPAGCRPGGSGLAGWLRHSGSVKRASAVLALCEEWQPGLMVCDEIDFGSAVIAERLGLPLATVLVIAAGSFVRPALVSEPLNRLRAEARSAARPRPGDA